MRKNIIGNTIVTAAIILCLSGCSKKTDTVSAVKINEDTGAFSEYILNNVSFADTLSQLDSDMISKYYDLPDSVTGVVYIGSGATSEEFSVLQAPDEKTAKETLEAAQTHIDDQIESFKDYLPLEVEKLQRAYIKQIDNDVIVIVSEDDDAKAAVNDYLQ